jgi:hypothetical protein
LIPLTTGGYEDSYLEISFFGLFEPAQIIVGAANIDMGSDVVILNPSSSIWCIRYKITIEYGCAD